MVMTDPVTTVSQKMIKKSILNITLFKGFNDVFLPNNTILYVTSMNNTDQMESSEVYPSGKEKNGYICFIGLNNSTRREFGKRLQSGGARDVRRCIKNEFTRRGRSPQSITYF